MKSKIIKQIEELSERLPPDYSIVFAKQFFHPEDLKLANVENIDETRVYSCIVPQIIHHNTIERMKAEYKRGGIEALRIYCKGVIERNISFKNYFEEKFAELVDFNFKPEHNL